MAAAVNVFLAIPFWPLYLPLLLARPRGVVPPRLDSLPDDKMTSAILQVERELSAVLSTPVASSRAWAKAALASSEPKPRDNINALP